VLINNGLLVLSPKLPRFDSDNAISDFWSGDDFKLKLGDKIAYNNTNTVDWLGAFAQAEYTTDKFSAYGTAGVSSLKYTFVDHFIKDGGDELTLDPDANTGYQIKGGGLYNITGDVGVFANFGLISKAPNFDGVISDVNSSLIDDPSNEEIVSAEVGANFSLMNKMLTANLNIYNTNWNNRVITVMEFDEEGRDDGLFVLRDLDAVHRGVEMDFAFQPMDLFRLDGAVSIGTWEQTNNTPATYKDYVTRESEELMIYTEGLKIGDAPQTQFAFAASVFPIEGLHAQVVYKYYDNYFADYNISQRLDPDDTEQSWKYLLMVLWMFIYHTYYQSMLPALQSKYLHTCLMLLMKYIFRMLWIIVIITPGIRMVMIMIQTVQKCSLDYQDSSTLDYRSKDNKSIQC
jgi:hypothetical protein